MTDRKDPDDPRGGGEEASHDAISIVQRGNLKTLEQTLRKQWRLGQNIVLCWSADERGLLVIFVPHYFLGNFCAADRIGTGEASANETFVRELISGRRRKTRDELFAVSRQLDVAPTFIKLNTPLTEDPLVLGAVEQLIKRYGLGYVESRAVILFDIVEFSLFTPFEQASQLNSLSYSLNSAYNKLLARGIQVHFARTTTGDGYYVWNRDLGPRANRDLFYFMALVVADNAVARAASRGNTVPVIRTGYHIGGHYELFQAEGVNPTVFSYIVGEVTIELARMVDMAQAHQVLVGDFSCDNPEREAAAPGLAARLSAPAFVGACNRGLPALRGTQLSGRSIGAMSCHLSEGAHGSDHTGPRRFRIVDKHGLSRHAYNLEIEIDLEGEQLGLGLDDRHLPGRARTPPETPVDPAPEETPGSDDLLEDLASLLKKRRARVVAED